jgi:dTDP-4-amino-4,6-dideoxygalactose transaminase
MTVPFLDLSRQTVGLEPFLSEAIDRVLRGGRFVLDEEVKQFEEEFARYCGVPHAIGVASGTDAIAIALAAVGVGPGDEVITVANTCVPTIVGIESAGAKPVLVDPDVLTYTLDPALLESAITSRTRAVVPVHLYGQCAPMDAILEIAQRHNLRVVEDCAQAHGAELDGRRAGSIGDAAAFSFYPTKNLGAFGDGGAVVTASADTAASARLLRNYGERDRFEHVLRGRNSRLDELQAAVLRLKLAHLDRWNDRRREIAGEYTAALADTPVVLPHETATRSHVYHLYVIRSGERDRLRGELTRHGIGTAIHYPRPVHRQPAYRDLEPGNRSLGVSETLTASILSLPMYPELTDDEVERVAETVASALAILR